MILLTVVVVGKTVHGTVETDGIWMVMKQREIA